MNIKAIMKLKMGKSNTAEVGTVGEYLNTLLQQVFLQGEGFSGKRPFGDSGWESEIFYPLVESGLVLGNIYKDEDGWEDLEIYNHREAQKFLCKLIDEVFEA